MKGNVRVCYQRSAADAYNAINRQLRKECFRRHQQLSTGVGAYSSSVNPMVITRLFCLKLDDSRSKHALMTCQLIVLEAATAEDRTNARQLSHVG